MSWLILGGLVCLGCGVLVCASPSLAATHTRTYTTDGHVYVVEYDVEDTGSYAVPLTLPVGQPHYNATITVSEVVEGRQQLVTAPFAGQWTPRGCFEDDPESLVKEALERRQQGEEGQSR